MADTYLFLGGSNTAAGRFWLPQTNGLGCGYVAALQRRLSKERPDVAVINKGHDGFTVPALLRMLTREPADSRADAVCVLIGINDVGVAMNTGVPLQKQGFADSCRALLQTLRRQTDASLLLLGPFLFPRPQEYENWMDCVREAEDTMRHAAREQSVPFLALHAPMNRAAALYGCDAVTTDGIHLTEKGHQILADLIYPHLP